MGDGANETVRKGSGTLRPAYVKAVEETMINQQQKYAAVVLIVSLVKMNVRNLKDVAGNQQLNVRTTVKRSGGVVNALVNVKITMVVASLKLDTVSVIVKKGFPLEPPKHVLVEMIQPQRFVSVVNLVVHASENVRIMRVVEGNRLDNARVIVKRNGESVKPFAFFYSVYSWFL